MSWVLYTNALAGRRYLRDYRRGEELIWTPVVEKAEKFVSAEEAITMARRLSFILGDQVEALSMPQDAPGETCTTLHCGRPVEPGRMHCGAHSEPWSHARREPLSNDQIDEAAAHAAARDFAGDEDAVEIASGVHAGRTSSGGIEIMGTGAAVRAFLDSAPAGKSAAEVITGAYLAALATPRGIASTY